MEWDPSRIRAPRAALRLPRDRFAERLGAAPKTVQNWEEGRNPPGLALLRALDEAWESVSPEQKKRFFAFLPPGGEGQDGRAAATGYDGDHGAPRDGEEVATDRRDFLKIAAAAAAAPEALSRMLGDAAQEAMAFTRHAGTSTLGRGTLDHLRTVLVDIERSYDREPPAELFRTAASYRARVDEMIQGRHTLAEGRELYVCAAWLSEQLAWLAWDLGGRTAAKAYALDCWHHADQAGHDELCGWAMDLMSVIALYDGRPEEAALEARKGIARLPTRHPLAVRLRAKAARAHAQMGDREGCESQLGRARRAYDRLPSRAPMRFEADAGPVALYVMTAYSASASVWLGDYGKARERAEETLAVHASLPERDRRPGREAIARCDLG